MEGGRLWKSARERGLGAMQAARPPRVRPPWGCAGLPAVGLSPSVPTAVPLRCSATHVEIGALLPAPRDILRS